MNRLAPYASVLGGNAAARPAGLQAGGVAGDPAAYLNQYMTAFRGKMGQPGRINPPGGGTAVPYNPAQPGRAVGAPTAPVPGGIGNMPGGGPIAGGTPRPGMPTGSPAGVMPPGMGAGMPAAMGGFGPTSSGLSGAEQALMGGLGGGMNAVNQAMALGRGDLMTAGAGANQTLNAYYNPGFRANDYQAALSGALGGQAQQQAMDNFMGSPGQQYLLNESERAIRRNAAATGGLGGANVQRALQENAIGLAAQDFDNAFNRLGSLSDRGLAAGGQISGNTMATGQGLANLAQNAGQLNANMLYGTGNNLAAGRTRAGEMIAGNIQDTTSNLANMMYGTGRDISNVTQQGASNLAQLLAGSGRDTQAAMQAYATLLANLSQGVGSQVGGLPSLGGTGQNPGILGGIGDLAGGLGSLGSAANAAGGFGALFGLSDVRLKKNIRKIGEYKGANIYSWQWKDPSIAEPTVGVIAQEHPQHSVMGADGYLRVNYGSVFNG